MIKGITRIGMKCILFFDRKLRCNFAILFDRKLLCNFAILCICFMMTGCGVMPLDTGNDQGGTDRLQVICTTFPLYDWTREIAGGSDAVEVSLLLDNGVDMHSYQPSAADIARISSCDMLVYAGGTSDAWLEDVIRNNTDGNVVLVNLMQVLGDTLREEEYVEGMQGNEHASGGHDEEYDEHVWLSIRNAVLSCEAIKNGLCSIDAGNGDLYEIHCREYTDRLNRLDAAYAGMVEEAGKDTLLFADRFPFLYLMKDYDIRYYAAFPGCSSETAASFETVAFLAARLREEEIGTVLTLENGEGGFSGELAETIIRNAGVPAQVLSMNSMQSVTKAQIDSGITYYSVMEQNLEVLKKAMNE